MPKWAGTKPLPISGDFAAVKVIDDPNSMNELSKSLFRATVALGGTRSNALHEELRIFDAAPGHYGGFAMQAGMTARRASVGAAK